jgi:hypothetical protein
MGFPATAEAHSRIWRHNLTPHPNLGPKGSFSASICSPLHPLTNP